MPEIISSESPSQNALSELTQSTCYAGDDRRGFGLLALGREVLSLTEFDKRLTRYNLVFLKEMSSSFQNPIISQMKLSAEGDSFHDQ